MKAGDAAIRRGVHMTIEFYNQHHSITSAHGMPRPSCHGSAEGYNVSSLHRSAAAANSNVLSVKGMKPARHIKQC